MVIGFAGIFGGNARPAPVSGARPAPAIDPQAKTGSSFSPVLHDIIHPLPGPRQKHVISAKTLPMADANLSPLKGPQLKAVVTTPTPSITQPIQGNQASAVDTTTVIDTLKAALVQAGVDVSGMHFDQHQDVVTYPGGSYVNDLISFQSASGRTHEYMSNLTEIAPQVTVVEIQQLMAGNRG